MSNIESLTGQTSGLPVFKLILRRAASRSSLDMVSLFGGGVLHKEGDSEKSNEIIPVVVSGS